jgi:hypothetical protein
LGGVPVGTVPRGAGPAARNPRVTDVRLVGDRAAAAGSLDQTAILVKQDRLWLIARYG